jgi:hypothetical protein
MCSHFDAATNVFEGNSHVESRQKEKKSRRIFNIVLHPPPLYATNQKNVQDWYTIRGGDYDAAVRGDDFGRGLSLIDDWDGNGVNDLLVGAPGLYDTGCVMYVGLSDSAAINDKEFMLCADELDTSYLSAQTEFGYSIAHINGGVFVVGAPSMDTGGALWLIEVDDFALKSAVKIDVSSLNLAAGDYFGSSVEILRNGLTYDTSTTDLDHNDETYDIAVGAPRDDDLDVNSGALYILHVYPDGTLERSYKIAQLSELGK